MFSIIGTVLPSTCLVAIVVAAGCGGGDKNHGHDDSTAAAEPSAQALEEVGKLPAEDREAALAQKICLVTDHPLGAMGVPRKVVIKGRNVFLCCKACEQRLIEDPDKYLRKLPDPARQKSN